MINFCYSQLSSEEIHKTFSPVTPLAILEPSTIDEVRALVREATEAGKKISIAGARRSKGGQTSSCQAVMIDTKKLNRIINLDVINKKVIVQAGITWDKLEEILNTVKLSIKARQSYSDFSVGGSIGVNAHGQCMTDTMLIDTIDRIGMVLADGSLVYASREENSELFYAAVGGYGLLGVIVEVTLSVTDDLIVERKNVVMPTSAYTNYFFNNVHNNPKVEFHSARLSMNPSNLFDEAISITRYKTLRNDPELYKLNDLNHVTLSSRIFMHTQRLFDVMKKIRIPWEYLFLKQTQYESRNNSLRYATADLKPLNNSRDCLQEYFVPCASMHSFLDKLKALVKFYDINLLNVSIRFVAAHQNPLMSYAREDSFAFVLYFNIPNNEHEYSKTQTWTRELIDHTLALNGTFYLPYEELATKEHVHRAFPGFIRLLERKNEYDPLQTFTNALYEHYK